MLILLMMLVDALEVCDHPIYCQGDILHSVQTLRLFHDCKTFVDMPMKYDLNVVLQSWEAVLNQQDVAQVMQFVSDNFNDAGTDSIFVQPTDWHESPAFLSNITDIDLRDWASEINKLWLSLSKKFTNDVNRSSFLETPFPFFVPGGRFREFYYWDTLWVVDGLLGCQMLNSAIQMNSNFLHFIDTIGYVPNGARIYYKGRSQPMVTPMITDKIYEYLLVNGQEEQAINLIKESFAILEKEFKFFFEHRSVRSCQVIPNTLCDVKLFHFDAATKYPRPESYREDLDLASFTLEKQELYRELAAGAESGWDYSSRWFKVFNQQKTIQTTSIIPIDFNVMMVMNMRVLAKFAKIIGEIDKQQFYNLIQEKTTKVILENFYNEPMHQWNDYNRNTNSLSGHFFPANFFPMLLTDQIPAGVIKQLEKIIDQFPGGIPTSYQQSGQQWDLPNSWPPLNQFIIQGLLNNNQREIALKLAQKWISNGYCSFQNAIKIYNEGLMFEKYDATKLGNQGGGGEYEVQAGFGWTNGVAIWIFEQFGTEVVTPTSCQ